MIEPKAVAVFGSSQTRPGSREWAEAEDAGRRIAGARLAVVTAAGADGEDIHLAADSDEASIWLPSQPELG